MIPSPDEKDAAIARILRQGLVPCVSLPRALWQLLRQVGLRTIFYGLGDILFLCALLIAALLGIFLWFDERILHDALFVASPAVYILLHALSEWRERQIGLYELKRSCKHDLRQINAFQMLCFGAIGAASDFMVSGILCGRLGGSLGRFWGVSLCALFLYAALQLFALLHAHRWAAFTPLAWVVIAVIVVQQGVVEALLMAIPAVFIVVMLCALMGIYLLEIRAFLRRNGAMHHAYR